MTTYLRCSERSDEKQTNKADTKISITLTVVLTLLRFPSKDDCHGSEEYLLGTCQVPDVQSRTGFWSYTLFASSECL